MKLLSTTRQTTIGYDLRSWLFSDANTISSTMEQLVRLQVAPPKNDEAHTRTISNNGSSLSLKSWETASSFDTGSNCSGISSGKDDLTRSSPVPPPPGLIFFAPSGKCNSRNSTTLSLDTASALIDAAFRSRWPLPPPGLSSTGHQVDQSGSSPSSSPTRTYALNQVNMSPSRTAHYVTSTNTSPSATPEPLSSATENALARSCTPISSTSGSSATSWAKIASKTTPTHSATLDGISPVVVPAVERELEYFKCKECFQILPEMSFSRTQLKKWQQESNGKDKQGLDGFVYTNLQGLCHSTNAAVVNYLHWL
ncbi:hypothetical protein SeMB42_g00400 [Synchytrium endobioticum]|uniref:Uncharacterized protein n=1 Tax=Synchytrium endobioticum TaxID=286115 RepID=A0A507DR16_9FUNG|nr:hypothetical protein SeLEV6574_g02552 [Synchytrium endobioticum]TPX54169.1 hypothetical protein SeMB42_g00400 [Synchytrium endobioticum]